MTWALAVGDARGTAARPAVAAVVFGVVAGAVVLGAAAARWPLAVLAVVTVLALAALVVARPAAAAYLLVGLTPLVAGIDRDRLLPLLRPNEALLLLCAAGVAARAVWELRTGQRPSVRPSPIVVTLLAMAVANSVVPLARMAVQQVPITADDVSYAAVLWKFLLLYAVVRYAVRTAAQARRCLLVALGATAAVAVVAILQSLHLLGVPALLDAYYAPFGDSSLLDINRGTATLGLAVATGDLMIFSLALAVGLHRHGGLSTAAVAPLAALLVAGTIASGQFSTVIGLAVALVALAVVLRRTGPLLALGAAGVVAAVPLAPVIARRLAGFDRPSGLPESWEGRLANLRTHFWPTLFSDHNYLLGVRPAARVPSPERLALPWVWIESGYTWLLWGGGLPLLAAFVAFVVVTLRTARRLLDRPGPTGAVATAVFVSVLVVAVLMALDPHLTYRGSADLFFALLAVLAALEAPPPVAAARPGQESPT